MCRDHDTKWDATKESNGIKRQGRDGIVLLVCMVFVHQTVVSTLVQRNHKRCVCVSVQSTMTVTVIGHSTVSTDVHHMQMDALHGEHRCMMVTTHV